MHACRERILFMIFESARATLNDSTWLLNSNVWLKQSHQEKAILVSIAGYTRQSCIIFNGFVATACIINTHYDYSLYVINIPQSGKKVRARKLCSGNIMSISWSGYFVCRWMTMSLW